jgi:hypothetical protein
MAVLKLDLGITCHVVHAMIRLQKNIAWVNGEDDGDVSLLIPANAW